MANTAPVPHAPASIQIAPGVSVNNQMTPTQILEAHVKANVQPHQGGVGHTDGTVARMNYGDAASKAPPSPAALEAANKPIATPPATTPDKRTPQEQFEADIRARGLTHEAPPLTAEQQTEADIALVTEQYKTLMQAQDGMGPDQRLRFKAAFEKDIARILNGQLLTPGQRAQMGKTGNIETFVPKDRSKPGESKPTETPASTYTPEQWAEGHKSALNADGHLPVNRLNPAAMSGYTLPAEAQDQVVTLEVFSMLAKARQAGFTQAQVDAFVRADIADFKRRK